MKSSLPHEAVPVLIHPSQFPQAIEAAMRESLRTRRMNHKFHYDTPKQTFRWLRLHEAFSPARRDVSCLAAYENASRTAVQTVADATSVEILSLGCGGGQKEAQLIRALRQLSPNVNLSLVAADVSAGLALMARNAGMDAGVPSSQCVPFVMDLAVAEDWAEALRPALRESERRLITFFGMMPNFTPGSILPKLAALLRPHDLLLVSANLAPGKDYAAGVEGIRPLYENDLTREWLLSVLLDLGVERADGNLAFRVENCPEGSGLRRIEADFIFSQRRMISYGGEEFVYEPGERFQLFFSYRHTRERVADLLGKASVKVGQAWTNDAGDEGVFLGQKTRGNGSGAICTTEARI